VPVELIAPQLATGKVALTPKEFHAALPTEHRDLFLPDAVEAPVQLPLADVLANLPEQTLRMRADQESHIAEEMLETPFSVQAAEDAARFEKEAGGSQKEQEGRRKSE